MLLVLNNELMDEKVKMERENKTNLDQATEKNEMD
jgi:hypothetical protein